MRIEGQITKLGRKVTHTKTQEKEKIPKSQPQICLTKPLELINQKISTKQENSKGKETGSNTTNIRGHSKKKKKFYQQGGGVCTKTNQQLEVKETK